MHHASYPLAYPLLDVVLGGDMLIYVAAHFENTARPSSTIKAPPQKQSTQSPGSARERTGLLLFLFVFDHAFPSVVKETRPWGELPSLG